jgi:hypothetical protein
VEFCYRQSKVKISEGKILNFCSLGKLRFPEKLSVVSNFVNHEQKSRWINLLKTCSTFTEKVKEKLDSLGNNASETHGYEKRTKIP